MNYYKKAIQIMEYQANEINYRRLLMHIAMNNPSAITKAAEDIRISDAEKEKNLQDIRWKVMREDGQKVAAIKEIRAEKGMPLKYAKEYVEAL